MVRARCRTDASPVGRLTGFSTFFIAAVLASALGCASTSGAKPGTTGAYVDDARITTKVKAEIFKEPSLQVSDINVETRNNVVELSGFVDSAGTMSRALAGAQSVEGVGLIAGYFTKRWGVQTFGRAWRNLVR